mgnify:CR=1 FL=1
MSNNDGFDLTAFLPYLLNQAAEESSLAFTQLYKNKYGMLRTEWRVLFHLGLYGRLTASDIGQRARMHKTKISRAVAKLAARRFLTRVKDGDDRRVEWLELTPAGQAAYRELRGVAMEYDAQLARAFSPEEMAVVKRVLRSLAE